MIFIVDGPALESDDGVERRRMASGAGAMSKNFPLFYEDI